MANNEKQLNEYLSKCNYKYKDMTKRDVTAALNNFKELEIIIENYCYPNGACKDLISLKGTIPVMFKNNRYNIPVQLYLADTHPYHAPICYVRPTNDMEINVSQTVSADGRVLLPEMKEWRYPQSDIYMLINMMIFKFSEETPLFSKASRPRSSTNPNGGATPSYPYPTPYPSSAANVYPSAASSQPPYPTGYPTANTAAPVYPGTTSNTGSSSTQPQYPTSNTAPYPVQTQPPYPSTNTNPYYPSMPTPYSSSNFGQTRPTLINPSYPTASNSYQQTQPSYSDDTIKPEYYKLSLISAISDKARIKYGELSEEKRAEIDSLYKVRTDLEQSSRILTASISDGELELRKIGDIIDELKKKTTQLNENINKMKHRDNTNIEDAVITTTPLYHQLMNSFAEELAIQDLIYYLGEGLANKTINLDSFLKMIRLLTRRQFILRATMQKARQKASLPI